MNTVMIYPGSFDPVTYGHLNIIERGARLCDRLVVGVLENNEKSPLFSVDERVNMIREAVKGLDNVEVKSFHGMQVDFAKAEDSRCILRGIRTSQDYEYELPMCQINKTLYPEVETVFLFTDTRYSFVSSSAVRTLGSYGAQVSEYVPPHVEKMIKVKFKEKYNEQD